MKLSEAILLGSIETEQAFGRLHDWRGGTCAYGAALTAAGCLCIDKTMAFGTFVPKVMALPIVWKWAFIKRYECPDCHKSDGVALSVITHLNDTHFWTRPRIAEWVAQQERKLEEVSPVMEEVQYAVK